MDSLVDRIYEASAVPEYWQGVLDEVCGSIYASGGVILTRRNDLWTGARYSNDRFAESTDVHLRSDAAKRSQTTSRLLSANRNDFVTNDELFTEEEYRADSYVTDWAAPNSMHHAVATAVRVPSGDLVVFHFIRREGEPPFGGEDVARLNRLRPHLARSGMLATRWRLERLRTVTEALATVGLPGAILDPAGRVIVANGLIQGLKAHVVWRAQGQIGLTDSAADAKLGRVLAEARHAGSCPKGTFPSVSNGGDRAIVHLLPISPSTRDLFEGGYGLLVITPVEDSELVEAVIIQGLFDLTQAEASIARAVGEGLASAEIAARHGVSVETVRTQLSAVFAKTGLHRRADLVALLARLPRIGPADGR